MNGTLRYALLALAASSTCLGTASAQRLTDSQLEARLAKMEILLAARDNVQPAAYCEGCGSAGCCCQSNCGCGESCCSPSCNDCCSCGSCGDGCGSCGCGDYCSSCGGCDAYYAEVELMFMRAHVLEDAGSLGKLSEEYELAPRFILGYENGCGQGARVRYWHYGHQLNSIDQSDGVRFEWDVIDLEYTNRLQFCRTDVTLAGGFRYASTEIVEDSDAVEADLIGVTAAADIETLLCCDCCSYWSFIYGGRLAILGGDWEGRSNAFTPTIRDDNVLVTEFHGGVEYGCCYCGYDLYTQLKIEIQNWHSDAIAQNGGADSIGFIGPVWTIGMGF